MGKQTIGAGLRNYRYMYKLDRTLTALLALADSWDNTAIGSRLEADKANKQLLASKLYGYGDGLSLAAAELRTLIEQLVDGDKHNGKA